MYSQTRVLFSLGLLWAIFCSIIYFGAHHYFLIDLLRVGNEGNQEILINRYAFTQIMNHYFIAFIFMMLCLGVLVWRILRRIFKNHTEMLLRFHHTIAEQVETQDKLNQKISMLEKRIEKMDIVNGKLHAVCDHLNSMNTSLSLIREKVQSSSNQALTIEDRDSLIKEFDSMSHHFQSVDEVIKSIGL